MTYTGTYTDTSPFCSPQRIQCGAAGRVFTFAFGNGPVMAAAAGNGDWTRLVPGGLDTAAQEWLLERLGDPHDRFDLHDLYRWAMRLAPEVYGVPWHVAGRLCGTAEAAWTYFDAWCLKHQTDPRKLSARRICVAVLAWLHDNCGEQKDLDHMEMMLWAPPDNADALERIGEHRLVSEIMRGNGNGPGAGSVGGTGGDSQSVLDSWNALPG